MDGLLLVDKARGLSSHAVVAMARRALATRAVGHAGTLDPLATGLLVLGVGEGTKLLHYASAHDKGYLAAIQLGVATDSWDADGAIIAERAVPTLDRIQVNAIMRRFEGTYEQRAPAISAIKRGGEALYKKVRRGEQVQGPMRTVTVHELVLLEVNARAISLRVRCGKGFYVRSLAHDLSAAIGTVGHLRELRREHSGGFSVEDAAPFALLEAASRGDRLAKEALRAHLLPLSRALTCMTRLRLDEVGEDHARHGRPIPSAHVVEIQGGPPPSGGPVALFGPSGTPLAIAELREGRLQVVRGFRWETTLGASPPIQADEVRPEQTSS